MLIKKVSGRMPVRVLANKRSDKNIMSRHVSGLAGKPGLHGRDGFTLVEVAIVLVIIGLILGGVFKGQALVDSARVRSMSTEIDGIRTAWLSFNERYRSIPGDFPKLPCRLTAQPLRVMAMVELMIPQSVQAFGSSCHWQGSSVEATTVSRHRLALQLMLIAGRLPARRIHSVGITKSATARRLLMPMGRLMRFTRVVRYR